MRAFVSVFFVWMSIFTTLAKQTYILSSPDEKLNVSIYLEDTIKFDVKFNDEKIIDQSCLFMKLDNGKTIGLECSGVKCDRSYVDEIIPSPYYRASEVKNQYNEVVLHIDSDWDVEFRAYNDGIAYRYVYKGNDKFNVLSENVEYNFNEDLKSYVPYVTKGEDFDFKSQLFHSFENTYSESNLTELNNGRLMFLPVLLENNNGVKVCITESGLENYPGLYLHGNKRKHSLKGLHAEYPKCLKQGGYKNLQMIVEERYDYIAKIDGKREFPWRISIISDKDTDIAASNLSFLLAQPSRLDDISWIKPGKVAWEWWNGLNLDGVDFKTGINNETYKAYIDFASENGIEYVILDEGWSVKMKADLMSVVDEIDLQELINYASKRNVGIILWAGYYAFAKDMENICRHYSQMGVKGFKVDFLDRDDQDMINFCYDAAAVCAKYKLLLDLHGTSKPAGLNRTYPNVLNFEGVHGLEQMKWKSSDQVKYDVMLPFIRQVAGPMDYTQGAMRNAIKANFRAVRTEPMSQGTRCRQLALYVVFDSPLNMLCDSPSNYRREAECTEFISKIPTVWDETIFLSGTLGEYIIVARRKGNVWYVGGITDWKRRNMKIDLSFLDKGEWQCTLFKDGMNADKVARDYKKENFILDNSEYNISMAPGGGFVMVISKI